MLGTITAYRLTPFGNMPTLVTDQRGYFMGEFWEASTLMFSLYRPPRTSNSASSRGTKRVARHTRKRR